MSTNKQPDRFNELFRQGTSLLHQGNVNEAVPLLQQAHELDPSHVDAGINLAGAYILSKQFKSAVAVLEPLRRMTPDNAMIWTNLGAAYLGNPILATAEQQQQAITAFEKALEIDPAAPNVAYNIGLIYRDRQEKEKALHWFQRAVRTNPRDKDARRLCKIMEFDG
jgi:tetratricopeptide (TPR) repeat protein